MQTIRERIQQLKAEVSQLEALTKYDGITLDSEIRSVSSTLNLETPTYTVLTRGTTRFLAINDR